MTSIAVMIIPAGDVTWGDFSLEMDLVLQARAYMYGSPGGQLSEEMMDSCVQEMVDQHKQKTFWEKGQ